MNLCSILGHRRTTEKLTVGGPGAEGLYRVRTKVVCGRCREVLEDRPILGSLH